MGYKHRHAAAHAPAPTYIPLRRRVQEISEMKARIRAAEEERDSAKQVRVPKFNPRGRAASDARLCPQRLVDLQKSENKKTTDSAVELELAKELERAKKVRANAGGDGGQRQQQLTTPPPPQELSDVKALHARVTREHAAELARTHAVMEEAAAREKKARVSSSHI